MTAASAVPQAAPARVAPGVLAGVVALVLGVAGVLATWRVFVDSEAGQRVDEAAFEGAQFGRTRLWRIAEPVLEVVSVPFLVAVLVAALLIGVLRRRWALGVQAALLIGGANITTQVLKTMVLDRPGFGQGTTNTLPSGHTTVAASVSAAALLVVPPRARPWVALAGVAYTGATGVSTLVGRWHRPSDVVAGVLVVMAWTGLVAVIGALGRRGLWAAPAPASVRRSVLGVTTVLAVAAAGLGSVATIALRSTWSVTGALSPAQEVTAYGGGALGVAAVTCAAFAAMLLAIHLATAPTQLSPVLADDLRPGPLQPHDPGPARPDRTPV